MKTRAVKTLPCGCQEAVYVFGRELVWTCATHRFKPRVWLGPKHWPPDVDERVARWMEGQT